MNEDTARNAISRIVDQGVEAIAISLLWSTANDTHERRLRAASDALVTEQAAIGLASPFDPDELNRRWPVLEARVTDKLVQQGVAAGSIQLRRYAELRYALPINQVAMPAEAGTYDAASVTRLVATFEREY